MTYTTPDQKSKMLRDTIDNLIACAQEHNAQSFQMLLDYRQQVFEMIETFRKEDEDKIKFVRHVHNELKTRFENILQNTVYNDVH